MFFLLCVCVCVCVCVCAPQGKLGRERESEVNRVFFLFFFFLFFSSLSFFSRESASHVESDRQAQGRKEKQQMKSRADWFRIFWTADRLEGNDTRLRQKDPFGEFECASWRWNTPDRCFRSPRGQAISSCVSWIPLVSRLDALRRNGQALVDHHRHPVDGMLHCESKH